MRLAHFVPAYRATVHVEVAMSLAREASWCAQQGWLHMPFYTDCNGIARARNLAVAHALKAGAHLMLMQDADCFALPTGCYSATERLWQTMERHDVAVVGAAIPVRNGSTLNCEPARPGETYEGEVGTGLMLIDLRRLRDLPRPWFVDRLSADGLSLELGEDIGFCRLAKAEGHRVVVDCAIKTGHAFSVVEATA